jgi:tRNA pseudouridine55 synthase
MNGYILVDKPKDWTSFDVVAKVRGLARARNRQLMESQAPELQGRMPAQQLPKRVKVGHTGTLDPQATGLLVILIGTYTKRAAELTKLDKTYDVVMKLGETSTTADEEGEKTRVSDSEPSQEAIESALKAFTGDIMQTPPAYSAIKIDGVRAYKLAREGKEVKMEARPARINALTLESYEYPYVQFTADVSSGTYIRSLVEDVGKKLGTGAYMSDLRRTRVGQFKLDDAKTIEELLTSQDISSTLLTL